MWHRFPGKDGADRNYDAVLSMAQRLANGEQTGPVLAECLWAATGVFNTAIRDRVKGSTHYHSVTLQPRPAWARMHAPTVQAGRLLFYAGIL